MRRRRRVVVLPPLLLLLLLRTLESRGFSARQGQEKERSQPEHQQEVQTLRWLLYQLKPTQPPTASPPTPASTHATEIADKGIQQHQEEVAAALRQRLEQYTDLFRQLPPLSGHPTQTMIPGLKNPCWWRGKAQDDGESSTDGNHYAAACEDMERDAVVLPPLACLPYFYVLGPQKCGTTDLYHRLASHPEVVRGNILLV